MLDSARRPIRRGKKRLRSAVKSLLKSGRQTGVVWREFSGSIKDRAEERRKLKQVAHQIRRLNQGRGNEDLARRPEFVILGAPKCGTSWLSGALAQHPEVLIVPDEIEYFSTYLDRPLEWYLSHFASVTWTTKGAGPKKEVCKMGEKSASYCGLSPERIRLMHELLPEAQLILMVRDPVVRHWAHAKQYFWKRYVRPGKFTFEELPRKSLFHFFRRTKRFGEFSRIIANWSSVVPPERLLIVAQEHALASPQQAFDAVLSHIGASTEYSPEAMSRLKKHVNRGPSVPMPDDVDVFLTELFARERPKFQEFLANQGLGIASNVVYRH